MGLISKLLDLIDNTVALVGETGFMAIANMVVPVFQTGAVLVVALTGINLAIQAVPMTLRNGLSLIIRLTVVSLFLSSWTSFYTIYDAITNTPTRLGGTIMSTFTGSGDLENLNTGLDKIFGEAQKLANTVSQNGGWVAGAIASVVLLIVATLMSVIAVIVMGAAKLLVATMILLGPIAIAATIFKQSAGFFDAWVRVTLGASLVPVLVAAMAGFAIGASYAITGDMTGEPSSMADLVPILFVLILGTGLIFQVPSIASGLAQASTGLGAVAASTFYLAPRSVRAARSTVRGIRSSSGTEKKHTAGKEKPGGRTLDGAKMRVATALRLAEISSRQKR